MKRRTATHLTLALLVAVGLGVSNASAAAQGASRKKPAAAKTTGGASGAKKKSGKARSSSRRAKGQKAPTSDRISEIQQALAKDGSYAGAPNGKWDDATVAAVKKFQEARGLNPSGKLDAKTLQQLGLGSQTAGVAPPMPPVSSSSTASPSKTLARRQ
jgi:peptidoglycan hydrolase-like protein with peptidoglycan-binding domain